MARYEDDDDDDYDDDDEPRSVRKRSRKGQESSGFVDFLLFRRMIAPVIIMIFYWILTSAVILGSLGFMVIALMYWPGVGKMLGLFMGLLYLVLGPLVVRVMCEVSMLAFRQYDVLTDIKKELEKQR